MHKKVRSSQVAFFSISRVFNETNIVSIVLERRAKWAYSNLVYSNTYKHVQKVNEICIEISTSRDRPKSAPYPRLKNSKRTSKCKFTVLENRKTKNNRPSGALKGETLLKLSAFLSQLKGEFSKKKVSQCRKTEGRPFGIFKHPFCCL